MMSLGQDVDDNRAGSRSLGDMTSMRLTVGLFLLVLAAAPVAADNC
jgi:hypothetical protein